MQEVINRLKKSGVKLVQNDGIELTYDQAMTSFHLIHYELKERLNDYMRMHGLEGRFPDLQSVIKYAANEDVRQLLKDLNEHPSSQEQFYEAFFKHRENMRKHINHYFQHTHCDAILYPTISL